MTIAVTAATGQLGQLVLTALLARGVAPTEIVAVGRTPEKLAALAPLGVQTRVADYSDPDALDAALSGVDRVLLISGSEVGQREVQHQNVIDAARRAEVDLIAYTSLVKADTSGMELAREHVVTERAIAASGLRHSILRNGLYLDLYVGDVAAAVQHGTVVGACGDTPFTPAARADLAAAAAAVLTSDDPAPVHELGGAPITRSELAAAITSVTGSPVTHTDLEVEAYAAMLVATGMPEQFAALLADGERGIARGDASVAPDDLAGLLGGPATSLLQAVRDAVESRG